MRIVTQNVLKATLKINDLIHAQIQAGLVVFVGFTIGDDQKIVSKIANKILDMRIFPDKDGKTNLSLTSYGGELMIVPNFTLYGNVSKGRRPSFSEVLNRGDALALYSYFFELLKQKFPKVESGVFHADMKIDLVNDGPFTMIIDSVDLE